MTRVSPSYNGWAGVIRDVRGTAFYKLPIVKPKPEDTCDLCGVAQGSGVSLSWHAEEYGHTWKEYYDGCRRLCPRCHGMIHTRFQFPNLWQRYKHKVREENYGGCTQFPNLMAYFAFAKRVEDIPYYEPKPTGVAWLDALPSKSYKGPPKIATWINENGEEVPDPRVYDGAASVAGVIIRDGITTAHHFPGLQAGLF